MTDAPKWQDRLQAAYDLVRQAKKQRNAIIKEMFRPGQPIRYWIGYNPVEATLIEVCGRSLLVRGLNSGKEYVIDASRVLSPWDGEGGPHG